MADLIPIIKQFPEVGEVQEIKALTSGLINQTYLVKTIDEKAPNYVLQRINNNIFCDVDMLQHNIEVVTGHIRQKLVAANEDDIERKVLRFVPATSGKTYYNDETGYWRVSVFIPESQTLEAVTPESSYLAGLKFGEFQAMLADVPEQLGEIIPNFHNMEFRLQQLREAVADNKVGRLSEVQDIVDAIEKDAEKMCSAEQLHREGKLPKRICHCDTKVSNMMFDMEGKVLCVIDLDTIMPSFIFSDFGDFLRSAANTGKEDDADLNNVQFNMKSSKHSPRVILNQLAYSSLRWKLRCCLTPHNCSHTCRLFVSWLTTSMVILIIRQSMLNTTWFVQKHNTSFIRKLARLNRP